MNIKKIFTAVLIIYLSLVSGFYAKTFAKEDELEAAYAQTAAQYTNYRDCIKLYKLPFEKLFYLALSSIEGSKFELLEIQSRNGYIVFKAEDKEFLISVYKKDKSELHLKYFKPEEVPEFDISYTQDDIKAIENCNIHGLWGEDKND